MKAQRTSAPSPSAPPTTARAAQAAVRREQILSAALALFSEHGYAGTSTRSIAEAVGVTEGLVFHYFPTKDALLLALASRHTTFAGRILALVQDGSPRTARELLAAVAEGYAEVSSEEAAFVAFVTHESLVNPVLRGSIQAGTEVVLDRLVSLLERAVEAGELRDDAPLRPAMLGYFGGFSFFFAQHRELSGLAWRTRASEFARAWADTCWRGLASARSLSVHSANRRRKGRKPS